jgi:hypothetical protein
MKSCLPLATLLEPTAALVGAEFGGQMIDLRLKRDDPTIESGDGVFEGGDFGVLRSDRLTQFGKC